MDSEPHERDAEPARVDHLHHPVDPPAVARRPGVGRLGVAAGQPGPRPVEVHLAGRDPDRPELGFEALDVEPVGRAVGLAARHDERGQSSCPLGRALGTGQHDEDVGVHVGAEVLVSEQQPLATVGDRPGRVGADVATTLALGQEHPALPGLVWVEAVQAGDEQITDRQRCVPFDDVGSPTGHPERAVGGGLALAQQVGACGCHHRRHRPTGVMGQPDEPGADEVGLVGGPGGVVRDLADVVAPPVVAVEDRAVGVGHFGPGRQNLADQLPVLGHVLLGELAVLGVRQVPVQEEGKVGVERVPVEADRLVVLRVVGEHWLRLRPIDRSPGSTRRRPARNRALRLVLDNVARSGA